MFSNILGKRMNVGFGKKIMKFDISFVQSLKEWCIPPDFLIYVLVCTAQSTKSMKTNDIPF